MEIKKIIEFDKRIWKVMKILEFHTGIMKFTKSLRIPLENQENYENHRIQCKN